MTGKVIQNTGSLKDANRDIQGLATLLKEQNSGSTFKSKFGFRPGIFNNKNAASKNSDKVTKVIDNVDNLSCSATKLGVLIRQSEVQSPPQFAESDYISSGDSQTSNNSSISTSDSDRPAPKRQAHNLNRSLDLNSNTAPTPPAKPLRSADRRALPPPPTASPRLRRVAASPLGSPRSPRSPRPKPRLLPKPSTGPSPYRSLATTTARPLVTSASGDDHQTGCARTSCVA